MDLGRPRRTLRKVAPDLYHQPSEETLGGSDKGLEKRQAEGVGKKRHVNRALISSNICQGGAEEYLSRA